MPDDAPDVGPGELPRRVLAALAALRTDEGWLAASSVDGRFASLFGRDSLIASLQVLPADPAVALATLDRLGRELGTADDPETEQERGKVPHEVRTSGLDAYLAHGWPVRDGVLRYYGSEDASCWWLVVFGALARHGHDVRTLRGAAGRVAARLAAAHHPVTYRRRARSGGLAHHWWRDVAADIADADGDAAGGDGPLATSGHGMVADDGSPMTGPVAVAAVQALAWRALTEATDTLDHSYRDAATRARDAFLDSFVAPEGRQQEPVVPVFARHPGGVAASATSDLGHVLWSGVLDGDATRGVQVATAERLAATDLRTEFGLRTLPAGHRAFRPSGYHTGGVWPFDTWLGAAGLAAAGLGDVAASLSAGVVCAVDRLGGFAELYAVEDDGTLAATPEACTVQAWTVGAVAAFQAGWDGRAWA